MPTLRRYLLYITDDPRGDYTRDIVALSAGKARYEYWSDFRDAHIDFPWSRIRSRSLGVAYPGNAKLQSENDRRKLEILRHALGLDHFGLNKQGGHEGYRNHYASGRESDGFDFLMSMCSSNGSVPLMSYQKADALAEGLIYFHVTIGGSDFVKRYTGVDHREPTARPVRSYKRAEASADIGNH